jgi:hypothetical protein
MKKSVLVGLCVLAISTSAASAWTHHSYRNGYRAHHSSAYRATMAAQREAINRGAYNTGYTYNTGYYGPGYYGPGYARSGFWPADVAGAAVGTGGAVAAGAVNTAGAIATAPFRPANPYYRANSYAYYPANSYGMAPSAVSSKDREMYVKNLHDSGYDPKNDFNKDGTIRQH